MKNTSLKVRFNKNFKKIENSEFVEGTALIAYQDENRNYSDIPEEAFNYAMPSLPLIPIVGNWLPEKNNFGGHDLVIEKRGTELVFKDNTVPYGVVKENHNAQWVDIEDEDGVTRKYLQADVVLWAGRYEAPVQKIIDDGVNQSMEVNIEDYEQKENGYFQIKKFEYSALCILGRDRDENGAKGEDDVEPCFEGASIVVKSEEFDKNFEALKFALEGKVQDDSDDNNNEPTEPEGEFAEPEVEPVVEPEVETKPKFMLNSEKREALREAIPREPSADEVDYWYWVMDFDDNFVYVEEEKSTDDSWERLYFRYAYSISEDDIVAVDASSKEEIVQKWVTKAEAEKLESAEMELKSKIDELTIENESYKANLKEKETLLNELQNFKADIEKQIKQSEIDELFENFEDVLKDNEEFVALKDKAIEMEVSELEKELYALVGKVKYQAKGKKEKKVNYSKVAIVDNGVGDKGETKTSRYGTMEQYFKKK